MIVMLLCGAGVGAGLWAMVRGWWPPRASLTQLVEALGDKPTTREAEPLVAVGASGWAARVGRPAVGVLTGLGVPTAASRRDLAITGRSLEQQIAEKATGAVVNLLAGPVLIVLLKAVGWSLPFLWPAWLAIALAAGGFLAPDLGVRVEAARRRADFRHALSTLLDLVVIALAGGAGVEQALYDAASIGTGWPASQIRQALHAARLARTPAWAGLAQLGTELGIDELVDLAATMSLAGSEGAKVRASLAAKAASLRAHELAEAETAAQTATERMSLPVVALFAGFLLFIGYPAVTSVLTGL
jgi:Flp pilus assembly protein TadB